MYLLVPHYTLMLVTPLLSTLLPFVHLSRPVRGVAWAAWAAAAIVALNAIGYNIERAELAPWDGIGRTFGWVTVWPVPVALALWVWRRRAARTTSGIAPRRPVPILAAIWFPVIAGLVLALPSLVLSLV